MNYIKSLHIEGFKKFTSLNVEFNEHMNILVGENEAGKSTILDAIKTVLNQQYRNADKSVLRDLFNTQMVAAFETNPSVKTLPRILIEVELAINPKTKNADYFYGEIPCARSLTKEEIEEAYEKNTGLVIIETFKDKNPVYVPGVLCTNHGPFTWGADAAEAVHNAVVLEEVAKMAYRCEHLNPEAKPAPQYLQDKHFFRKHGANAYYGQGK